MKSAALARVLLLCGDYDAALVGSSLLTPIEQAAVDVVVTMADGRRVPYRLALVAQGDAVHAREASPDKLPGFCPPLHINPDGTFCTGWSEVADLDVTDDESAAEWWSRLHSYLRLQHRAKRLRKWPGKEWAHGEAAYHQYEAERQAAILGDDFVQDLEDKKIRVDAWNRLASSHGRLLRVYRHDQIIYLVSERQARVLNTRQKCVCVEGDVKRHRRLRSCSGHANAAAELALSLWKWAKADERFSAAVKNMQCCGRMQDCRLKVGI